MSHSLAVNQPEVSLMIEAMLLLPRIATSLHYLSCDEIVQINGEQRTEEKRILLGKRDRHDGLDGSTRGSSMVRSTPKALGKLYRP